MYLFSRDVAYPISLNMADMNNRKINRKGDSSTGHAQFEFSQKLSQVYTSRHGRLLTPDPLLFTLCRIDYGKLHPQCKLDMQKR